MDRYRHRWTSEQELLATVCELLSALLIVTVKAYGGKGNPQPLRIKRPGDEQKVVTMTAAGLAAALRSRK